MAQFNHPEFSGSGQWMNGGMTMVSDMFNNYLKGRVDGLCSELANIVASQPDLLRSGSFQSQSQGSGSSWDGSNNATVQVQNSFPGGGNWPSGNTDIGGFGQASLFVAPAPGTSANWWPADLQWPNSTGAQNNVRYAYFAQARRLVIDLAGTVTVYDTLDHQIGGFSQQQSGSGTLGFSSQYGLIDVASLPVISSSGVPPAALSVAPPAPVPVVAPPVQAAPVQQAAAPEPVAAAPVPTPMPASAPWPAPVVPPVYVVEPVLAPVMAPLVAPAASTSGGYNQSGSGGGGASMTSGTDIVATIERLADLRAKGILSDAEFAAKKADLLSRL
jgi:hypothetical protein